MKFKLQDAVILPLLFGAAATGFSSCANDGGLEEAGEDADEALEDTGEAIEDAAEEVEDEVEDK